MSNLDIDGKNVSDDVGDLFDYDVPLDDILNTNTAPTTAKTTSQKRADDSGLGLDEEVKVAKARAPVAKLDEDRLLSQNGIPKLRRKARSLKFKGKGYELSDAARLLSFYQLWLDDLFPRAKFADGLAIIEKLGHTRRLQTMRRQWIDEERLKHQSTHDQAEPARDGIPNGRLSNISVHENAEKATEDEILQREDGRSSRSDENNLSARTALDLSMARPEIQGDDDGGLFLSDTEGSHKIAEDNEPMHDVPENDELEELLREQEDAALDIS